MRNLKNTLSFKKSFRGAGRESSNLAITISANQPIKGGMLQVIAEESACESHVQKDSALAGAEGYGHEANPRAGRSADRPAKAREL